MAKQTILTPASAIKPAELEGPAITASATQTVSEQLGIREAEAKRAKFEAEPVTFDTIKRAFEVSRDAGSSVVGGAVSVARRRYDELQAASAPDQEFIASKQEYINNFASDIPVELRDKYLGDDVVNWEQFNIRVDFLKAQKAAQDEEQYNTMARNIGLGVNIAESIIVPGGAEFAAGRVAVGAARRVGGAAVGGASAVAEVGLMATQKSLANQEIEASDVALTAGLAFGLGYATYAGNALGDIRAVSNKIRNLGPRRALDDAPSSAADATPTPPPTPEPTAAPAAVSQPEAMPGATPSAGPEARGLKVEPEAQVPDLMTELKGLLKGNGEVVQVSTPPRVADIAAIMDEARAVKTSRSLSALTDARRAIGELAASDIGATRKALETELAYEQANGLSGMKAGWLSQGSIDDARKAVNEATVAKAEKAIAELDARVTRKEAVYTPEQQAEIAALRAELDSRKVEQTTLLDNAAVEIFADQGVPDSLIKAKATFTQGKSKFGLQFEDPIDKAFYMVAAKSNSTKDAVAFIQEKFPALTEQEIKAFAKDVRDFHVADKARELPLFEQPMNVNGKAQPLSIPAMARERLESMFSPAPALKSIDEIPFEPGIEPTLAEAQGQIDELTGLLTTGQPPVKPNGSRLDGRPVYIEGDLSATPKGYDETDWKDAWSKAEVEPEAGVKLAVQNTLEKSGYAGREVEPEVMRRMVAEELYARSNFVKVANENAEIARKYEAAVEAAQAKKLDDMANNRNRDNSASPADTLEAARVEEVPAPLYKRIKVPHIVVGVVALTAADSALAAGSSGGGTPEAVAIALGAAGIPVANKFRKRAFSAVNKAVRTKAPLTQEMVTAMEREAAQFSVTLADGSRVSSAAKYSDIVAVKASPDAQAIAQAEWDAGGHFKAGALSPDVGGPLDGVKLAGDDAKAGFSTLGDWLPFVPAKWSGIPLAWDTAAKFAMSKSATLRALADGTAYLAAAKARNPGTGLFGTNVGAGAATSDSTLDTVVQQKLTHYSTELNRIYSEKFDLYLKSIAGRSKTLDKFRYTNKEDFDVAVISALRGKPSTTASVNEAAAEIRGVMEEALADLKRTAKGAGFGNVPDSVIGKLENFVLQPDTIGRNWSIELIQEGQARFGRENVVNVIADAIGERIDAVKNKDRLAAKLGVGIADLTEEQIVRALRAEAVTRAERLVRNIEFAETGRTANVGSLDSDHISRVLKSKGASQEEVDDVLGVLTPSKGGSTLPSFMRQRIKLNELAEPRVLRDLVTGEMVPFSVADLFDNSPQRVVSGFLRSVAGMAAAAHVSKRLKWDLSSHSVINGMKESMLREGATVKEVNDIVEHLDHLLGRGSNTLYQQETNLTKSLTGMATLAYGEFFGVAAVSDLGNQMSLKTLTKLMRSPVFSDMVTKIRTGEYSKPVVQDIANAFGLAGNSANPFVKDLVENGNLAASRMSRAVDLATHYATKLNGLQAVTSTMKMYVGEFQMSMLLKHAAGIEQIAEQDFRHMAAFGLDSDKVAQLSPILKKYARIDSQGVLQGFDYKAMRENHNAEFTDLSDYIHRVTSDAVLERAGMGQAVPFMTSPSGRILTQFMSTAMMAYQRGRRDMLNMDGVVMQRWTFNFMTAAIAHMARAALIAKSQEEFDKRTDPSVVALSAWRNSSASLGFGGNVIGILDLALPGQGLGGYVTSSGRVSPLIPPAFAMVGDMASSLKMASTAALTDQELTYSQFKHINGTFNPALIAQLPINWAASEVLPERSAVNAYTEKKD